ncbi:MAG: mechanosensitive ion channel [Sphingobacteriia bacterium]|nr:mechanosensitive ion channel [Sphingobacteriia bacterium]
MKELLRYTFLDNSIKSYLIVMGTLLLLFTVKRIISKYFAGILYKLFAQKGKTVLRQAFINLIIPSLELFLMIFVGFIAVDKLKFPSQFDFDVYHVTSKKITESLASGILIIVFIRLCLRVVDFIAMILEERANQTIDQTDNQLILFFKDFFKVLIVINGVLMVLHFSLHKDVGNLLTGLSIVGAAVALATRESLENLIASFIIFFDKPFTAGDTVKVHAFTGIVEKIGLRSTRIRTEDKTLLTVPNKQMVDSLIDNLSLRSHRKAVLQIDVNLSASAEQLKQLSAGIKDVLKQKETISTFHVFVSDTGKNAHTLTVDFLMPMPLDIYQFQALREEINLQLIDLLNKMNLSLAAASTDVVVSNK